MKRHTAGHNKGTLFNLLWAGCFFLFCSQLSAAAPNQIHGQITVADQKLTLVAEKAPLESLLQQIAAKSDLAIVFHGSLAQTVTLSLHDLPLEQGLRRLLKNCSFSFQYKKELSPAGQERIVMTKAVVFAKDVSAAAVRFDPAFETRVAATEATAAPSRLPEIIPLPQPLPAAPVSGAESEQRVGNGIFVKADRAIIGSLKPADIMNEIGGQTTGLRLGLAGGADLGNAEAGGAEMEGVGVTSISQGSIFEKIGLQPGDVIQDINGIQPTTPNQMADALHQAISESGGMVRIEVERGDIIEPIYIEIDTTQDET